MLLRNYCNSLQWKQVISGNYQNYIKTTAGVTKSFNFLTQVPSSASFKAYGEYNGNTVATSYIGLAIGSGTTPVTFDDYKIEQPNTTLTDGGHTLTVGTGYGNNSICVYTQTVTNETSDPITISELGVMGAYSANAPSTSYSQVLYTRDVITPVTIGVGETKTFVLTIDFAEMSTSASAS